MPKSIAICGIRGIPANYGGFETFAEEISPRLVEHGHRVRVYGRSHVITHKEKFYKGVELVLLPSIKHKYLETPVHTLLCILHLLFNRVDLVLVCNGANSPFLWILKLARIPTAINLDGIERLRGKWNTLGKLWYALGERCSVWFGNQLISDAEVIRKYYLEQYGAPSQVIAYGYNDSKSGLVHKKVASSEYDSNPESKPESIHTELGVEPNNYFLYVSRLEPENNAHVVVQAYRELSKTSLVNLPPLVIVGDAPYASEYIEMVKNLAKNGENSEKNGNFPNIIFAGYRFGEAYVDLQIGALVYIQATEVGGTHPALVEAMGFGNCIIVNDTPENCEVLANSGLVYKFNDPSSLCSLFFDLLVNKNLISNYRKLAFERAQKTYSWSKIANDYSDLAARLGAGPRSVSREKNQKNPPAKEKQNLN